MQSKRKIIRQHENLSLVAGLIVLSILFLQGCHSRKIITGEGIKKVDSPTEWLSSLQDKQLHYETFSAKLNVEISDNNKNMGSKVDLKMIKGETLQLSVQPLLGIEVFRIQFTPDSVKLIDRLNKVYAIENYSSLKKKFPIDFDFNNLQALFTNQLFVPGKADFDQSQYNRFRLNNEVDHVNVLTKERSGILYEFKIENNRQLTKAKISEPSSKYALEWNYMDFRPFFEILFPMNMDVQVLENESEKANMKIRFSKIQNNTPIDPSFNIPSRYRKVDLVKLMESLLMKETK